MRTPESLFDVYARAVLEKDVTAFTSIFDGQVRIFDMWNWEYEGLAPWKDMAAEWFGSLKDERVLVTFGDIQIKTEGNMAVATAFARFAALSSEGKELRFLENRLTWVMQKKNDLWKIIHEHTSGPVDQETMKVVLKR